MQKIRLPTNAASFHPAHLLRALSHNGGRHPSNIQLQPTGPRIFRLYHIPPSRGGTKVPPLEPGPDLATDWPLDCRGGTTCKCGSAKVTLPLPGSPNPSAAAPSPPLGICHMKLCAMRKPKLAHVETSHGGQSFLEETMPAWLPPSPSSPSPIKLRAYLVRSCEKPPAGPALRSPSWFLDPQKL